MIRSRPRPESRWVDLEAVIPTDFVAALPVPTRDLPDHSDRARKLRLVLLAR
jgi:hypothetical protein